MLDSDVLYTYFTIIQDEPYIYCHKFLKLYILEPTELDFKRSMEKCCRMKGVPAQCVGLCLDCEEESGHYTDTMKDLLSFASTVASTCKDHYDDMLSCCEGIGFN